MLVNSKPNYSNEIAFNENKSISIIIPVYNIEKDLDRCMTSLLSEDCEVHEIILVDDGSTDGSALICDTWAERSANIRCIHKSNGGVSSARNVGLEAATGDYILFVDGDDCIAKGGICAVKLALNSECDCYLFGYSRDQIIGGNLKEDVYMPINEECTIQSTSEFHDLISLFLGNSLGDLYKTYNGERIEKELGSVWRMAIKRSVIEENRIRFDEEVHLAEDMIFAVSVLKRSKSCQIVHQCIYQYWLRDDSATHKVHNYRKLINNKKSLFEAREKLSNQDSELQEMYEGSAILSSVQVAMWAASKGVWDRGILKDFCEQPYVKRSYQKLRLNGAPLKYKLPFFLLKHKLYSWMLLAVKTLNVLGISMYGHI